MTGQWILDVSFKPTANIFTEKKPWEKIVNIPSIRNFPEFVTKYPCLENEELSTIF